MSAASIKTTSASAVNFSMVPPPQASDDVSGNGSRLARDDSKSRLTNGGGPSSSFDLEKELQAIPALRPEEFQRRIQANRQQPRLPQGVHPRQESHGGQPRPDETPDLRLSSATTTSVVTSKKTKAQKQNPSSVNHPQAHPQVHPQGGHQQPHHQHQPRQHHQLQPQQVVHQHGHAVPDQAATNLVVSSQGH